MGQEFFRRPVYSPEFDCDRAYTASTNGCRSGRLVRFHTNGTVRQTTGSSGRASVGISLTSASSGSVIVVRHLGIANAVASTAAIAKGAWIRGNAGASTSSSAGCARTSTNTTGGFGARASVIGVALSSVAAGAIASTRVVSVLITHSGQVLI